MVRTRSQARGFLYGDLDQERECRECERQQENNQNSAYRINDRCRRHRLPDNEEKTEQVTAYRRRKPR